MIAATIIITPILTPSIISKVKHQMEYLFITWTFIFPLVLYSTQNSHTLLLSYFSTHIPITNLSIHIQIYYYNKDKHEEKDDNNSLA